MKESKPSPVMPEAVWIILPAYNEGQMIHEVLKPLCVSYPNVVVIDDGSFDDTAAAARQHHVHLLRHPFNLGQGAALQTGISYALGKGASILVTFDSDGQMEPSQIASLCEPLIQDQCDVALGSRFLGSSSNLPLTRRLLLRLAAALTARWIGLSLTDVHNGFRALTREAASHLSLQLNGMAHASEILEQIARARLRVIEVPVTIHYTDYSLRKGQSLLEGLNILWDLILHGRRFPC